MTVSLLPITIVPIKMFQSNEYRIQISHSLLKYWNIDIDRPLIITIGINRVEAIIEGAAIMKEEIKLSENIFQEFSLPIQENRLLASYSNKDSTVTFGPIIGLLTELNDQEEGPDFRSVHTFCEELHDMISNIGGFFFVFQLKDWTEGKLNGFCFQNEQWQKTPVPLPDVIYNRIHSRKLEASPSFQKFKTDIASWNIPIFNDQFLSKEKVHQYLYSEEHMQPYLPETVAITEADFQMMIKKYPSLYIKPIHGSQGRNIIRISKINKKLLAEMSTGMGEENTRLFDDYTRFYQWFKPYLKNRTFLAQASIPLMTYKNRPLDFRILCHKNFRDSWKATSAIARISADQQFVSNIARGGEMMKPFNILAILSNRNTAIQQLALMKELAVEVASIISQRAEGLIGELGIDIGVDQNGKLWIIEVNAKPSKNFEGQDKKIRPSAKALIEYCTFLAFSNVTIKEE
ncbi:YheC/YheD family protein [Bacillus sp. FJAT-29790]|uniref:YheC/YheD family endospore coat-associated protein n=1 Tax=Bacillus sp. FJAT-29790 TaxID=1895002 RepID=UPI0020B3D7AE|nr:YheC/YheD family protein [Bacillus sp. FJAT-29790]